jgi:xylulose-5-phosphate/fructose-6-phosphate phosphoketolase
VLNDMDRFHLFGDVVERVPQLAEHVAGARQFVQDKLRAHRRYIEEHGVDMPEILDWTWNGPHA